MYLDPKSLYEIFRKHPRISTDTRAIGKDSLFFALRGAQYDANQFAQQALDNGSIYAIVDDPLVVVDDRFLLVEDVLESLQQLASLHRELLQIPILGITGTNGKTTSKELLAAVLSQQFKTYATVGNLNNHIGVPLTLLAIPQDAEIALVEMGANHPGEIAFLCQMVRPTHGLITSLGLAHLEGFGSFENIVETKLALYRSVAESQGCVFVPSENALLLKASEEQDRYTYSFEEGNCVGQLLSASPFVFLQYKDLAIHTQLIGEYNATNLLAACCVGQYFGLNAQQIREGLQSYRPNNNRSQWLETKHNRVILDAYNANPSSLTAAIESFVKMNNAHPYFLLGDMLELGSESAQAHQKIVDLLSASSLEKGLLVGTQFSQCRSPFPCFDNAEQVQVYLSENPLQDQTILVKGSRGMGLERLIDVL